MSDEDSNDLEARVIDALGPQLVYSGAGLGCRFGRAEVLALAEMLDDPRKMRAVWERGTLQAHHPPSAERIRSARAEIEEAERTGRPLAPPIPGAPQQPLPGPKEVLSPLLERLMDAAGFSTGTQDAWLSRIGSAQDAWSRRSVGSVLERLAQQMQTDGLDWPDPLPGGQVRVQVPWPVR